MLYKLRDVMRLIVTVLVILEAVGLSTKVVKDEEKASKKGAPSATVAPCFDKKDKLIGKSMSLVKVDSYIP